MKNYFCLTQFNCGHCYSAMVKKLLLSYFNSSILWIPIFFQSIHIGIFYPKNSTMYIPVWAVFMFYATLIYYVKFEQSDWLFASVFFVSLFTMLFIKAERNCRGNKSTMARLSNFVQKSRGIFKHDTSLRGKQSF